MKILLFHANSTNLESVFKDIVYRQSPPQVPLGLCYIAAVLKKNNYNVKIIDNYLNKKTTTDVVKDITAFEPDVTGFSVVCTNIKESLEAAEGVKNNLRNTTIIFGGPQATISPEDLASRPYIDFVVVGEGEETMAELLDAIRNGGKNIGQCKGLFLRNKNGGTFFTGKRTPIADLDALPVPARELVEPGKYPYPTLELLEVAPVHTLCSSRGCPYKCGFCSSSMYWDRILRTRGAKNVVDEIELLIKTYGARGIYFNEDAFMIKKQRVVEICDEIIRREVDIKWICESRVDNVDAFLLEKMYTAGCRGVWCGVESGSQKVLDRIQKGFTVEQVREAYKLFKTAGLKAGASFMLGFPDETMDDVKKTLSLAKEIEPEWAFFQPYIAYPKSELYDYIIENKMYTKEWYGIYEVKPNLLDVNEIPNIAAMMNNEFDRNKTKRTGLKKRIYLRVVRLVMLLTRRSYRLSVFLKNIKNVYIDKYFSDKW